MADVEVGAKIDSYEVQSLETHFLLCLVFLQKPVTLVSRGVGRPLLVGHGGSDVVQGPEEINTGIEDSAPTTPSLR